MSGADWLGTPKDQTTYKATIAPDGMLTFERRDWDQVGSKHPKFGAFIPLMGLVSNDCIEDLFTQLGQVFCEDTSKPRTFEIVEVHAQSLKVHSPDWRLPTWRDLAEHLMGTGRPCEDFNVRGNDLFVRLKTAVQYEVEASMLELGGPWAQFRNGFKEHLARQGETPSAEPGKGTPRAVKKRKRPNGNKLIILQAMEKDFVTEAPTLDDLFDVVAERIECPKPKRRSEYFRNAVAQLADTEVDKWLWRHEGDRVALTSALPGGKSENI